MLMNGIVDRCCCRAAGLTGIGLCIRMEVNLLIMDELWSLISVRFIEQFFVVCVCVHEERRQHVAHSENNFHFHLNLCCTSDVSDWLNTRVGIDGGNENVKSYIIVFIYSVSNSQVNVGIVRQPRMMSDETWRRSGQVAVNLMCEVDVTVAVRHVFARHTLGKWNKHEKGQNSDFGLSDTSSIYFFLISLRGAHVLQYKLCSKYGSWIMAFETTWRLCGDADDERMDSIWKEKSPSAVVPSKYLLNTQY